MSDGVFVSPQPSRHQPILKAWVEYAAERYFLTAEELDLMRWAYYAGAAAALAALRDHRTTEVSDEITAFAEEQGRR